MQKHAWKLGLLSFCCLWVSIMHAFWMLAFSANSMSAIKRQIPQTSSLDSLIIDSWTHSLVCIVQVAHYKLPNLRKCGSPLFSLFVSFHYAHQYFLILQKCGPPPFVVFGLPLCTTQLAHVWPCGSSTPGCHYA